MSAKKKAGKAGRPNTERMVFLRSRCREIGVSTATLAHWENDGVDLVSDQEVREHIANLARLPKGLKPDWMPQDNSLHETPDMATLKGELLRTQDERTARRLATQIKGLADAEKLEILQSKFISIDEYQQANVKLGAALKAAVNKSQVDLPPMLFGLTQHQMQKVIRDYMDKMLERLSDKKSELW
jgi:hypothetical protein